MFVHGIQIVSELFVKELLLAGEGNVSQMSRKREGEKKGEKWGTEKAKRSLENDRANFQPHSKGHREKIPSCIIFQKKIIIKNRHNL